MLGLKKQCGHVLCPKAWTVLPADHAFFVLFFRLASASQSRPPSQLLSQRSGTSDASPSPLCPGTAGSSPTHVPGLQRTAPWMEEVQEANEDVMVVSRGERGRGRG